MAYDFADHASRGDPGILAEPGLARSDQGRTIEEKVGAESMEFEWGMLLLAAALSLAWGVLVAR